MNPTIPADLTLKNGVIYGHAKEIDTLIIKNGKIELLGPGSRLESIPAKRVIDLNGQAVYPGFVAAHDHFMMTCQIQDILYSLCQQKNNINNIK